MTSTTTKTFVTRHATAHASSRTLHPGDISQIVHSRQGRNCVGMRTLAGRHSSSCLFCRFNPVPRPILQQQRVQAQIACRSTAALPRRSSENRIRRVPQLDGPTIRQSLPPGAVYGTSWRPFRGDVYNLDYHDILRKQLDRLREELCEPAHLESLRLTRETFEREWKIFTRSLGSRFPRHELEKLVTGRSRSKSKFVTRMRHMFYAQVIDKRFTAAELENQRNIADLRFPTDWYPATRGMQRTIHLHVGPTNSGKTYHALKRLEQANKGIYLGPLRLLAHEVYTRMNAAGKVCALVTGDDQRSPEGQDINMWSCTVEMAPLNQKLDVAVIDEIQMINHEERGWAWTGAFLGVQAREVHLCGEARTVPLIKELCSLIGDEVHVHEYERLTPLQVAPQSLRGQLTRLEKGDCVVVFSVLGIHALRREIERLTGRKCAIVYGSLPPETRAQQARLFNEPDNEYDFLVASDAVGMGLNLSIKRVVFESTIKNNGSKMVPLQISELKQIAGRAGRYKTAHQALTDIAVGRQKEETSSANRPVMASGDALVSPSSTARATKASTVGLVTTLGAVDFPYLQKTMAKDPPIIETAGICPPSLIVERFADYFPPGTPFTHILLRLHDISTISSRFHLCTPKDQTDIADAIHLIKNISIADRYLICAAPTSMRDEAEKAFLQRLTECIAEKRPADLLTIPDINLEILDKPPSADREYLSELERLHKMIVTYLWLSWRFPHVLTTRSLAIHVKSLVENAIEVTLERFSWTAQAKLALKLQRRVARRVLMNERSETPRRSVVIPQPQVSEPASASRLEYAEATASADDLVHIDNEGEYPMPETKQGAQPAGQKKAAPIRSDELARERPSMLSRDDTAAPISQTEHNLQFPSSSDTGTGVQVTNSA